MQGNPQGIRHRGQFSRRRMLAMAGVIAGSAVVAACGSNGATETPLPVGNAAAPPATTGRLVDTGAAPMSLSGGGQTLMIEAFDFGYRTLGSLPGGVTTVRMRNTGQDTHHTQFMLLNPGVTYDQFTAALQTGPDAAFPLAMMAGGPGLVAPKGTSEVILDLKPGQYAIACFAQGADHVPHVTKGMVMPLIVTTPAAVLPLPATTQTITMFDFTFELPAMLPAGKNLYRVVNQGAQFHEFTVIQIAAGKTREDVIAFFDPAPGTALVGPPPGLPVGGMNALSAGSAGIAVLDLTPGEYVALCLVPDQSKPHGDSHLHLGMSKAFAVA